MRLLVLLTSLFLALPSLAAEQLFQNEYRSRFEGFGVTTTRSLTRLDDGTYLFRIESSHFLAKLDERSHFRITDEGEYQSLEHVMTRRVLGVRRVERTEFDWENSVVTFERRGEQSEMPLETGYTDRTLYTYLMELDLAEGMEMPSYRVVDRNRVRDFTFEVLGEEQLRIDGEELTTLKLRRVTDDDSRETLVWFAPSMDYRLVQIVHTEDDGSEYEMYIES